MPTYKAMTNTPRASHRQKTKERWFSTAEPLTRPSHTASEHLITVAALSFSSGPARPEPCDAGRRPCEYDVRSSAVENRRSLDLGLAPRVGYSFYPVTVQPYLFS